MQPALDWRQWSPSQPQIGKGIPSWAKYTAWAGGVLGGIILFVNVSPLAAGMVGATIGLLPIWPRIESWIQGEDV